MESKSLHRKGASRRTCPRPGPGIPARPSSCAVVFIKEPRAGLVKTRLGRDTGWERAALLYRAFVEDLLEWIAAFRCDSRWICYAPRTTRPEILRRLTPRGSDTTFHLCPQADGDLGDRLVDAFRRALATHARCVVLGSDAPLLGPGLLRRAFRSLGRADVVLGPARDGGYYLIGLSRPRPGLFRGISWSTGQVLEETLERVKHAGLRAALLPQLQDVDTLEDLGALRTELLEAWKSPTRDAFPLRTFRELVAPLDSPP